MTSEDHCWTDYPVTFHHPWEDRIFLLYRERERSGWLLQTGDSQQNKEHHRSWEKKISYMQKVLPLKNSQQMEYFLAYLLQLNNSLDTSKYLNKYCLKNSMPYYLLHVLYQCLVDQTKPIEESYRINRKTSFYHHFILDVKDIEE